MPLNLVWMSGTPPAQWFFATTACRVSPTSTDKWIPLKKNVTLFSIDKRVKLAAMAEYRKSLLPEGSGRNKAKDANLHLFRSVYPNHATIKDPDDKRTSSAARYDWNRLCSRPREGRMWLEVSDVFGDVGAFLALPPQCVPDRHILRMPAKNFGSWVSLLE